ncbi:sugar transferase [Thermatribacter velox]|uniref:Sugar transferase n=1 Tax=Thermatribacter velox TaxID=3039681 RepID=A0ABZ2YEA0_9BACT
MQKYLPLFDYVVSLTALYASFWLHLLLRGNPHVLRLLSLLSDLLFLAPLLPVFLNAVLGTYSRRSRFALFASSRLIVSSILTFFIFTTALFYLRIFEFPRLIILLWVFMNFIFFYSLRIPFFRKRENGRLFVLYRGEKGRKMFEDMHWKSTIRGTVVGGTDINTLSQEELRDYLRHIVQDLSVDRFLLILEPEERSRVTAFLEEEGIEYDLRGALYFFEERHGQVKLVLADLVDYPKMLEENPYLPFKEAFDRIISCILLLLLSPLFAVLALLIRLDSPGPVFYRQVRVGKDGKIFTLCKFRTMVPDAERETGAVLAQKNDPRITRIGRILRKTRLDELPQLWNVLRGEMSLIGPRPERPEFVEQWKKLIPHYETRLLVKPGITGWAQVCGRYDEGPETVWEKLEYDLYYLRNLSPSLDLEILARTILVVLFGKGAR